MNISVPSLPFTTAKQEKKKILWMERCKTKLKVKNFKDLSRSLSPKFYSGNSTHHSKFNHLSYPCYVSLHNWVFELFIYLFKSNALFLNTKYLQILLTMNTLSLSNLLVKVLFCVNNLLYIGENDIFLFFFIYQNVRNILQKWGEKIFI